MRKQTTVLLIIILSVIGLSVFTSLFSLDGIVQAQIPTISIPTVTGTPSGPTVTVRPGQPENFINVRSGPNSLYPKVGVLMVGQTAYAKGKSVKGEWILIEYPGIENGTGWVYSPYVIISTGELPVVEPPPLPTPQVTTTIDPTMAAQFIVTVAPTRLPTYTPPAPLAIPTFVDQSSAVSGGGLPPGVIIVALFMIGAIIGLLSIFQSR